MAGGYEVSVEEHGASEQEVELDLVVARETRVWSAAAVILLHEVVYDVGLELLLEIHEVVRNTDCVADAPRVVHVLYRAAALIGRRDIIPFQPPKPHRDPDYVVALTMQQQRGDRRVHTAAHCDYYLSLAHGFKPSIGKQTPSNGRPFDRLRANERSETRRKRKPLIVFGT